MFLNLTSQRLLVLVYQNANTIKPWGPHLAKTRSKNLLPLEMVLFPLTRARVNSRFTLQIIFQPPRSILHQFCSSCKAKPPTRQGPSAICRLFASRAVQIKSTHVLPTAASLVLLDPTEAPAPKKEKHW